MSIKHRLLSYEFGLLIYKTGMIGAGEREEQVTWDWHVPKIELVGALRVVFEAERLKMGKDLELVPTLLNELRI